jgi:DNA integrity scanning protein DisA with diadenylate cyclase activity
MEDAMALDAAEITGSLLEYSLEIASATEADKVLVYAEVFDSEQQLNDFLDSAGDTDVLLVAREHDPELRELPVSVIKVPDIKLTRVGQIKVAILLGLARGVFSEGQTLVCLTGMAESHEVDGILFMEIGEEFELFAGSGAERLSEEAQPEVLERIIDLAVTLGIEGREGKPVGTTFVLGDTERLMEHSEPMVLNPFKGYEKSERSILDSDIEETVKEFSTIDGAFIISNEGTVEAAGVYLHTQDQSVEIPRGLGARHRSAAAITALTDAVSVTVSETTGNVTVFRGGRVIMEIEKPRPIGPETEQKRRFFEEEKSGRGGNAIPQA